MKQNRLPLPVKIALLVAFLFMTVYLVTLKLEYNDKLAEQKRLVEKLENIQISVDELQNKLDTPFDEEYIIELAKEKLGYYLPDEIIFVVDLNE